jgi:hypothetical protein
MDSNEEEEQMFVELLEEETAATAQEGEHLLIQAYLSGLYTKSVIASRNPSLALAGQIRARDGLIRSSPSGTGYGGTCRQCDLCSWWQRPAGGRRDR